MAGYTSEQLRAMARPDRVRRAIHTDPAIVEIEMEKIVRGVRLHVGHESLVPTRVDLADCDQGFPMLPRPF